MQQQRKKYSQPLRSSSILFNFPRTFLPEKKTKNRKGGNGSYSATRVTAMEKSVGEYITIIPYAQFQEKQENGVR
jgi:hypothetical protein